MSSRSRSASTSSKTALTRAPIATCSGATSTTLPTMRTPGASTTLDQGQAIRDGILEEWICTG
jgi:hypothetical protein